MTTTRHEGVRRGNHHWEGNKPKAKPSVRQPKPSWETGSPTPTNGTREPARDHRGQNPCGRGKKRGAGTSRITHGRIHSLVLFGAGTDGKRPMMNVAKGGRNVQDRSPTAQTPGPTPSDQNSSNKALVTSRRLGLELLHQSRSSSAFKEPTDKPRPGWTPSQSHKRELVIKGTHP